MKRAFALVALCLGVFIDTAFAQAEEAANSRFVDSPQIKVMHRSSYSKFPDVVLKLSDNFSGFIAPAFANAGGDVSGSGIGLRMAYLGTSAAMGLEGVLGEKNKADRGVQIDHVDHDEWAFLHTTNPADLTVISHKKNVKLFWSEDDRSGALAPSGYIVLRYVGTVPTGLNWWENVTWSEVARVSHSKTSYSDKKAGRNSGQERTCYLVRSIDRQGIVRNYSLPRCLNYRGKPRPPVFLRHVDVERGGLDPDQIGDRKVRTVDVSYEVSVALSEAKKGAAKSVQVMWFGTTRKCGGRFADQCRNGFKQIGAEELDIDHDTGLATKTIDFKTKKLFGTTAVLLEEIVYRIEITTAKGNVVTYPQDGGFYVNRPNNRLVKRFFGNTQMNVANQTFVDAVVDALKRYEALGFNGVQLDEWRPEHVAIESFGDVHEASAIEFFYPEGFEKDPEFVDPWALALDSYAQELDARLDMALIGNTLKTRRFDQVKRASASLNGRYYQGCAWNRNASIKGKKLLEQFDVMDWSIDLGGVTICYAQPVNRDILNAERRIYTLAAFLMVHRPGTDTYLMQSAISPRVWGNTDYEYPSPNMFPEYFLNLGAPLSKRVAVGKHGLLLQRPYENGLILLNAGEKDRVITLPNTMQKVVLEGIVNRYDLKKCDSYLDAQGNVLGCEYNPGRVTFEPVSRQVTVPAHSGMILMP